MDRALYWGWKEGSQLAQYLIQPLHEHLEQIHSQARAPSLLIVVVVIVIVPRNA
jgi:hypothetical protein